MQTLLNLYPKGEYGVMRYPNWPYVRAGLQKNLTTVIRYYRRNPTAVRAQHFLVRLLQSITVPQSLPIDRYYSNVDARALNISMALKMTSSIFKGEIFKGVFYGGDNVEILIATDEAFDPVKATANWRNLCPVKVLRHPRSDLALNIPDGTDTGSETGLAVITINMTLLAVQYRAFRQDQQRIEAETGSAELTPMHFIKMFVLPNMLFSHLDVALFNRLSLLQQELPTGESSKHHPFMTPDYNTRVDVADETILNFLDIKEQDFVGTLKTIPAVTKDDMYSVMTLPDIAPTRQVMWGLIVAQLPVAMFLYRSSGKFSHARNKLEINQMQRAILSYKSDNTLRSSLPFEYYLEVQAEIDQLAERQ